MGLPFHLRENFDEKDGSLKPMGGRVPEKTKTMDETVSDTTDQPNPESKQGTEATDTAQTVETPPPTEPAKPTPEETYQERLKQFEEEKKALNDKAKNADALSELFLKQSAELEKLKQALAEKDKKPAEPEEKVPELTKEEQELYGEFAPVAQKLIQQATLPLRKQVTELEKRLADRSAELDKKLSTTNEEAFYAQVRNRVPDFDRVVHSDSFKKFLEKPASAFSSKTINHALWEAHTARELDNVVKIFEHYAQEQGTAKTTATPTKTGLESLVTPDKTTASGSHKPKPQYKSNDLRRQLNELRAGRITHADFLAFEQKFTNAQKKGLILAE